MRLLFAASALALAVAAGPVLHAQDTVTAAATVPAFSMTADQKTAYSAWPVDKRTGYDAWPANYQEYFWTLTPGQQAAWWLLSAEQRSQVLAMTPEQRTPAWASIEQQVAVQSGAAAPAAPPMNPDGTVPAASPVASALPGDTPTVVSNALPAPPAADMNKTYPVCTRTLKDSCRNPGSK